MCVFIAFRKPCSGYKLKEMTGSKIFTADNEDDSTESGSFDGCERDKPDLVQAKKLLSDAKCKELSGSDILGPPPEIPHQSSAAVARTIGMRENKDMGEPAPRSLRTSVKVSNVSCPLFLELFFFLSFFM
ncbi:hypothetical protein Salat_2544800 [Sesamum alatum]|uniref:DUF4057 domain-containing protein n=1 Tax=Sesamum alatum TaxID=300844 RepID=A0AAE1XT83_9LAMI|nr:hypothetical protein Salat_2544800 [Sesamum alatum]